jgi:putative ABC transport system permease protein
MPFVGSVLLALREMRRAKGRFALLTGAVGVLVFLIVFQQAITGGLVTEFVGAIRNQSADVLVFGEDARLNLQGSVVPPAAIEQVTGVDGVAEAGALGVATITVEAGGELRDATIFGHLLGGPGEPVQLVEGRRPERDGEAVASEAAADEGFDVGDRVVVRPGGEEIEVVGTAREISFSVTPTLFASFGTYEAVQLSTNPDAPAVVPSAVAVRVDEGANAGAVADAIRASAPGVEAVTRSTAADEAPGVEAVNQSFSVILLLTYVVATIVIGFFFLILTVQKRATLTLLRAIGAPARRLVGGLAVQVAVVVGGGLVVGTALATAALTASETGIEARIQPAALVTTVAALVVLAALACIGATRRIVRLDPAGATLPGAGAR